MAHDEELKLVARAKEGDMAAFEALYEMHKGGVFRTVYAITGHRAIAEEILQEAYLRAYRRLDSIHEDAPLSPWLYRVAMNLAYDWGRRRQRWYSILDEVLAPLLMIVSPSPEGKTEKRELYDLVHEAIANLGVKHRAVLVLYYMHDFSVEEVADILDCPSGTVKSRLYYARERLREDLLASRRLPERFSYAYSI